MRIHRDAAALHLYGTAPHNAFTRFTLATAVSLAAPYMVLEITHRYFERAATKMRDLLDGGTPQEVERLSTLMTGIALEADRLKKVSTWPWSAETLRGALTSVALPVLLFAITTVLGRFL